MGSACCSTGAAQPGALDDPELCDEPSSTDDAAPHEPVKGSPQPLLPTPRAQQPDPPPEFEPGTIETPSTDENPYPPEFEAPVATSVFGTFSTHGLMPQKAGVLPIKVNQDYGVTVYPFCGHLEQALLVVCDGHGKLGDAVSKVAATAIVEALETAPCMADVQANGAQVAAVLADSFDLAQQAVCAAMDATMSGTTVVVTIVTTRQVWTAHAGDSRALAIGKDGKVAVLTADHKPNTSDEYDRLIAAGGIVHCDLDGGRLVVVQQNGLGAQKMFTLGVSRGLGDLLFEEHGFIHEPAVTKHSLFEDQSGNARQLEWLVVASDGIWEVLSNELVAEVMLAGTDATAVCRELISRAKATWYEEEGDYRDDITVTVLQLPKFISQMQQQPSSSPTMSPLTSSPSCVAPPLFSSGNAPAPRALSAGTEDEPKVARGGHDFVRRKCSLTIGSGMEESMDPELEALEVRVLLVQSAE